MATVLANVAKSFVLTIGQGAAQQKIPFKAGVQQIDEALINHWYVQANLVGAEPLPPKVGSKAYADADAAQAAQIENLRKIADTAAQNLAALRQAASREDIDKMVKALQPKTPANEVTAALARQKQELDEAAKSTTAADHTAARATVQVVSEMYATAKAPAADPYSGMDTLLAENEGKNFKPISNLEQAADAGRMSVHKSVAEAASVEPSKMKLSASVVVPHTPPVLAAKPGVVGSKPPVLAKAEPINKPAEAGQASVGKTVHWDKPGNTDSAQVTADKARLAADEAALAADEASTKTGRATIKG